MDETSSRLNVSAAAGCPGCPAQVVTCSTISWRDSPLGFLPTPCRLSHVSARLSVNNCSSLPSPLLWLFALSPSSASCLSHLALYKQTPLFFSFPWLPLWVSVSLWRFFLSNNPLFLYLLFLTLAETPQPRWLVQLMSDAALPVSHEWGEASWPIIHHNTIMETALTNHSTSRLFSEQNLKSLSYITQRHKIHTQRCVNSSCSAKK